MSERPGWYRRMKPFLEENIESKYETLVSLDPNKEPTKIARNQGFIEGIQIALDYVSNRQKN